jgi:hypothetical protein
MLDLHDARRSSMLLGLDGPKAYPTEQHGCKWEEEGWGERGRIRMKGPDRLKACPT